MQRTHNSTTLKVASPLGDCSHCGAGRVGWGGAGSAVCAPAAAWLTLMLSGGIWRLPRSPEQARGSLQAPDALAPSMVSEAETVSFTPVPMTGPCTRLCTQKGPEKYQIRNKTSKNELSNKGQKSR